MRNIYEKTFLEEAREKKRIGSNIFSRKATKKGRTGALLTPYTFMSNKEKKQLNGKVVTYNMKEVLPIEQFETFTPEQRKEMLEGWRLQFENSLIIKMMGVTKTRFYKMLDELNVEKRGTGGFVKYKPIDKEFTPEEIEELKNNPVSYQVFKGLPKPIRFDVFNFYNEHFATQELADFWGVNLNIIYQARHDSKKYFEQQSKKPVKKKEPAKKAVAIAAEPKKEPEEIVQTELPLVVAENVPTPIKEDIPMSIEAAPHEPIPAKKGMVFNFENEGNASDLEHQLKTVAEMFKMKNKIYKFSLQIEEVGEDVLQEVAATTYDEPEALEVAEEPKEEKKVDLLTKEQLDLISNLLGKMITK